jgi:hypothetical protein
MITVPPPNGKSHSMVFTWNHIMAGARRSSPSATGVEMGCVVKVDPKKENKLTLASQHQGKGHKSEEMRKIKKIINHLNWQRSE